MSAYVTTTDTCSECGAKLSNAETARLNWQAEAANAQRRITQLEQELLLAKGVILITSQRERGLVEALLTLRDLQNGPPLFKYESEWRQAMDEATRLIDTPPAQKEGAATNYDKDDYDRG